MQYINAQHDACIDHTSFYLLLILVPLSNFKDILIQQSLRSG